MYACLRYTIFPQNLEGVSGGTGPEKDVIITYAFWITKHQNEIMNFFYPFSIIIFRQTGKFKQPKSGFNKELCDSP